VTRGVHAADIDLTWVSIGIGALYARTSRRELRERIAAGTLRSRRLRWLPWLPVTLVNVEDLSGAKDGGA